jgi:hypothetical protein
MNALVAGLPASFRAALALQVAMKVSANHGFPLLRTAMM